MQDCTHLSCFALVSRFFPDRYAKKYTGYCIIACVPMCVRTPEIIQIGVSYLQAEVGARWVQIMKTTLRPLFSRNTSNWALWWYYSFAKPINNYSGEYILLRSVSAKSLTAGERT